MMLDGLPTAVSDFDMECLFLLRKSDGSVTRLVQLRNNVGEVSRGEHHDGAVILEGAAFAAPEKFRDWCLKWGNFNWAGNQTALHSLQEDIGRLSAWKIINQVDSVGWLKLKSKGRKKPEDRSRRSEAGGWVLRCWGGYAEGDLVFWGLRVCGRAAAGDRFGWHVLVARGRLLYEPDGARGKFQAGQAADAAG
jgi:hypothetical protein